MSDTRHSLLRGPFVPTHATELASFTSDMAPDAGWVTAFAPCSSTQEDCLQVVRCTYYAARSLKSPKLHALPPSAWNQRLEPTRLRSRRGALLGRFRALLGASQALLGRSLEHLGPFSAVLGRNRRLVWADDGCKSE